MRFPRPRTLTRATLAGVLAATLTSLGGGFGSTAHADQVTPGNFTGYAFDQCLTPTQSSMDAWMEHSPFSAVGIYISGDSRACRNQPNLTPTWVSNQLANGWRLLPITLGPQANCLDRFPRYSDDKVIKKSAANNYAKAQKQARREAKDAVAAAQALGIDPGSTLWYDLEGFDLKNKVCRESAMWFLHGWTTQIHALDYVSGVYSSAGSGIKMLDDARVRTPGKYALPDRLWVARWDGNANLEAPGYLRSDGWMPHSRVKQFRGGHNETWGGVTINIDSNYLSLGTGTTAKAEKPKCREKVTLSLASYPKLKPGTTAVDAASVLQCLLRKQKVYAGPVNGTFDQRTLSAANAFRTSNQMAPKKAFNRAGWVVLLAKGKQTPVLKHGSKGAPVRRVQRALTAALQQNVPATGVFDARTEAAVKQWQRNVKAPASGVVNSSMWRLLLAGRLK